MGRTASGVKGIELCEDAHVVGVTVAYEGDHVLVVTDKGFGKISSIDEYRKTKRGAKGVSTLKSSGKIGKIVDVKSVFGDEDIMAITNAGIIIRTHLNEFRITGRNTQGVRLINLEDKQKVSSITIVPYEEDAPEVEQIVDEDVEENVEEKVEE